MVRQLFEPGAHDVVYVVDISGYVFRAYHAIQPLTSPSGEPTNAVFGTVNMLERLLRQCQPTLIAVAMDSGRETFRKELYPEYKAHRPPAPPELKQQLGRVEQLVRALGIPIFVQPGVEADDLIASCVAEATRRGLRVVIVSADKDLMPLVSESVLLWDTMRDRVSGPEEVEKRFGVRVDQVRDLLALMGDSSDNVPGVPSVGPKTAQKLLADHGTLEGIYEHLEDISRKKLRATLEEHRDLALLSQQLVTLKADCPLDFDTGAMGRPGRDTVALRALYAELGFQRQLTALGTDGESPPEGGGSIDETTEPTAATAPPAIEVASTLAQLADIVKQGTSMGRLALSVAVQTLEQDQHLVGIGLAVDGTTGYYVPLGHRYVGAPPQLPVGDVVSTLLGAVKSESLPVGGHDVKAVRVALALATGEDIPRGTFRFDALLASYLLDPESPRDLTTLAERELNLTIPDLEALTRPRRGQRIPLDEVSADDLAKVTATEAAVSARLWPLLTDRLAKSDLTQLWETLELPLGELLGELELRGVLVDVAVLDKLGTQIGERLVELEASAHTIAGREFNVNAPRQLEALLFDELGLKPLKRTKTARSTDAATLEALSSAHPLPAVVLEIRKLAKLKSTYIEALPGLVNRKSGRIHTRWGQATAATGRLASSDPNLQNIPIRTELGRAIRGAFIAPPGHQLVSADYSQIELRVLAHLSGDPVLTEAFRNGQDIHARTAMEIFGVEAGAVTAEHRRRAKAVNFGVVYGQGEHGLSTSLGIPRAEAASFIAEYFKRYKGVREFMDNTLEEARERGCVFTLLGRLRRVPDITSTHHGRRSAAERVAMNTPIQGTAADLLKLAMLKLWEPVTKGCRMILTVHDELVFEVPEAEVVEAMVLIKQRMEAVHPLAVPLVVDVGHGGAWDQAH